MTARKTERLLNLVICLLHTRRYLTVQQIRATVPGYESDSEDAFRRMFERDKAELRDLGVPLETGTDSAAHDDELGYRIARRDYELPPVALEPAEAAALGLAVRLLRSAPVASATATALLKLRAAGVDAPEVGPPLEPQLGGTDPALPACLAAVTEGRAVRFTYRSGGQEQERSVEPWGVLSWHGRWYLVGYDRGRRDTRVFRLSRVVGAVQPDGPAQAVSVPEGLDLRAIVERLAGAPAQATATVRCRSGAAGALRRDATGVRPEAAGWDLLDVPYADPERLADQVLGFGADVVVLAPADARAAVVARLAAAAG